MTREYMPDSLAALRIEPAGEYAVAAADGDAVLKVPVS